VFVSGKIAALIVLANKRGGFSEPDSDLALLIALQAELLIQNFQFQAKEKRRTHQLNLLNELVTEISLIRNSHQLLRTAVDRIQQHFSYFRVAAGWVEEASGDVHFDHIRSRHKKSSPKKEISVMTSPVKIGDTVVAVLEIQSDQANAFDASDKMVLEAVTSALGSAIQNANAYQNLERINAQLEEASKLKEEILQIVAHDFRSPLTVIRGYMDQLIRKEKWLDLDQKEIMQTVSQQAFRLQKLADATLKASRFDSGDIPFSFEKTDFNSFLRHLVFPWSEKHHFIVKSEKDLPIIKGDSGRLQEAMENLLSNAIKYSPDGGDVTIRLQKVSKKDVARHFETDPEQSTFLLVSISDQGIGIPPGKNDLLFRRFAKIHESRRIEGIGLGLYITKKIIEAHGGKIWLHPQKEGACFCFALPEYRSIFEENILVVEDDTLTLRLLHRAISNLGYEVITAWDGKEAIDKVFRFQPRVIVTDLMLPEISGEELIRRLRLNPETASIPIIVFTGKRDFNLQHASENSVRLVYKHQGVGEIVKLIREILTTEAKKTK
jgi:signal transduction histidine kinase